MRIFKKDVQGLIAEIKKGRENDVLAVEAGVRAILTEVREKGDQALLAYTEQFDGIRPQQLIIGRTEMEFAWQRLNPVTQKALKQAADNIRAYHAPQCPQSYQQVRKGLMRGLRWVPLQRAGLYVPGGRALYPSSVLMNAIPAQLAGVKEIIMVTPPNTEGRVADIVLAAAYVAGVKQIAVVGGAQAIAALAYGTESIPAVDVIVGPGNIYVAQAKRLVADKVAIDMVAGPSEVLLIADDTVSPAYIAADLLAQAEHDPQACTVLLTPSQEVIANVRQEIERQLAKASRKTIMQQSLAQYGYIMQTESIAEAINVANEVAPEHLELMVENAESYLTQVTSAGAVFLGGYTPTALGDYWVGTNHTLPTGGSARFASPLGVYNFMKAISYVQVEAETLERDGAKVMLLAQAEGLAAHAQAVNIRLGGDNDD